jgi:hypothetical protein
MTGRGSVTPGMACGSRPVKGSPQLGAFPAVGIRQRPGVKGAWPYAPLPPPPNGRLAKRSSRLGRNGHDRFRTGLQTPDGRPRRGRPTQRGAAALQRLQPSVGHHQPLATLVIEVDLNAALRAYALVVENRALTELAVQHPLAKTEAGAVEALLGKLVVEAVAGCHRLRPADLGAQPHLLQTLAR